ncbi:PREDICTED: lysM domain receptor-like kinase 3 [Ipomoea nil]|uniref:lysM domain receptor-like kinase 3 n=1 Tax=Ipomoea nil TaxID=35883 RepID=UPI000901C6F5|nr:PREDICTED: lysM domain receptor-like kinase 3 [Ipomoea nil]
MASSQIFIPLLLVLVFPLAATSPVQISRIYPFSCSNLNNTCSSILYQHNGLQVDEIANLYSVKKSQIKTISYHNNVNGEREDELVTVPCTCKDVNGTQAYFYETVYQLEENDSFENVSIGKFSGQIWKVGGEEASYKAGKNVTMNLLCGCVEKETQTVVTYTVQPKDTLSSISALLTAQISEIEGLNPYLKATPNIIDIGWLIYVPLELNGIPQPNPVGEVHKAHHRWTIIAVIVSVVALLSMCTLGIILLGRNRCRRNIEGQQQEPKLATSKGIITSSASNKQYFYTDTTGDVAVFESERPVVYSLEEIAAATADFDETRKIGSGGYGCVYYGMLGKQEVAIKKMRSNKSKEFIAELKVLCKIHHINVVELLGYATGDDHLCLVYEYIRNGSLSDHLHDPLLKGRQPLCWTARVQIALDAGRGIEYIHDLTKHQYVHRDIKPSNILLDQGLRAKVADFGLARLVDRTNEDDDDWIATRLVGTPGYLPPESVKELQITTKTDVFAFGVVLAELITGRRALYRNNKDPNKTKSLISLMQETFQDEDPESALESITDLTLKGSCPTEDVFKMAEIAEWCLSEEAVNRPEMREVVVALSQIRISSIEWEASLGGDSQVFSGVHDEGR